MDVIKIENFSKSYGKKNAVKNISLKIKEGEIFGFIGPNGAGKTTTIRTMLGLIFATSGNIEIFEKNITTDLKEILRDVGYLPAEVFYYDKMKAKDLLRYSASFYDLDCQDKINELSNILELDLDQKIDSMSLGNKKKVGIIQGLLHSPKLLILDEPTSGLDPLMQQKFFDILLKEKQNNTTIFFSSHILSEVAKICDRIAIIKDGEIVDIIDQNNFRKEKYVEVNFTSQNFDGIYLDNSKNTFENNNDYKFVYQGDYNSLLSWLNKYDIENLIIKEPNLEDIFLHYYV